MIFSMAGQSAMGLLFGYAIVWWIIPITVLMLIGHFLLPGAFYLWMALPGGGGMIFPGLYIHARW